MKRVASPGSMHDTGCLGLVHWDDPEGWNGDGGGRRVQDGEHMYTCENTLFIYLAALGISCDTGNFELRFCMQALSCGMWDLVP